MKTKLFTIVTFMLVIVTGCKDKENKAENTDNGKVTAAAKQNFSLELEVEASKKDDFALYYTEDNSINFNPEMALWHGVSGADKKEKIVYDLSEEKIPTDIRLDFGMNKEQEKVIVYGIKISYYGNEFYFKGSDFFKYFIESKDFKTEIDVQNQSLKIFKNGSEYKTPFFYPRQELIDALKKITTTVK